MRLLARAYDGCWLAQRIWHVSGEAVDGREALELDCRLRPVGAGREGGLSLPALHPPLGKIGIRLNLPCPMRNGAR